MLRQIKRYIFLCLAIPCLQADTVQMGAIPSYDPRSLKLIRSFLPYNPHIVIVGSSLCDQAIDLVNTKLPCAELYCFSSEAEDFDLLVKAAQTFSGIHPIFQDSKFFKLQGHAHLLILDCSGEELRILQEGKAVVEKAIVVAVKTHHQPPLNHFNALHRLMEQLGFELLTHHVYDETIGDALYVKSKYVTAVYRTKEG